VITRSLGSDGPDVAALSVGLMGMSDLYGPADEAESLATIDAALDAGITLLDSGDFYGNGHNELDCRPDQFADARLIDTSEGRALDDAEVRVPRHDTALDVVAGEAEGGLRQVVGAEREELGVARDVAGHEARPRQLDHGPEAEVAAGLWPDIAEWLAERSSR
jgi:Aldo/keto reductase family